MRGACLGCLWIGPWWRSSAPLATTAAKASMCSSTPGANAAQHAGWDASLVVAGTGPELPYWKRRVAESGREDDIRLLGFTKAISTLLAAADALVEPDSLRTLWAGRA